MSHSKHITKLVDQTAGSTTLVDDNELQFAADPNSTWALHFDLMTSADDVINQNGRMYLAIKAPAGSTVTSTCFVIVDDVNATCNAKVQGPLFPASQGTPSSLFGWGAPGSTSNPAYAWVRVAAKVVVGSTPGQVGLQFSEVSSAVTGSVVYAGSSLFATQAL